MGFSIKDILGGSLLEGISSIIGKFKLDPAERAKIQAAVDAHAFDLAVKEAELQARLAEFQAREIEAASAIIQAEGASTDRFTSRARPAFMWLMYIVIGWNFILLPIIQMTQGMPTQPIVLPEEMYWLFASGYLGYVGFRSLDKTGFKWNRDSK